MKHSLNFKARFILLSFVLAASLGLPKAAMAVAPVAAPIDLAKVPLATSSSTVVKPNLLFVLDNSGSMDWDHMPDDWNDGGSSVPFLFGYYGLRSSQCNQVYYDPTTTYQPPIKADKTSYADAIFTSASDGLQGGYDSSPTAINLNTSFKASHNLNGDSTGQSAYYYSYSGTQTTQLQKNYNDKNNTFYSECHSAQDALPGNAVFSKRRLATTETTTIVVGGSSVSNVSISDIKVNTIQIMTAASTGSTNTSTVATNIAAKIGNGFIASASGNTITITGPTSAANYTPIVTESTGMTFTADVFPDTTPANLTNFANWYSFYRTRMLMMKTAAGHAFSSLNKDYRVGLMKISSSDAPTVEVGIFDGTQRTNWYSALYN
ncbi:MAG: hypothetical protein ACXWTU_03340, partial [Methylotenera sp.]